MRVPSLVTSGRLNDLLRLNRQSALLPAFQTCGSQRNALAPPNDSLQTEPSAFIPQRLLVGLSLGLDLQETAKTSAAVKTRGGVVIHKDTAEAAVSEDRSA